MDYTTLSLAEVRRGLDLLAHETQAAFGGLDSRCLNWRPDAAQWSIAQCFEHLLTTNHLMFRAADRALDPATPRTVWQRLPLLPGFLGRMLIRSVSPGAARRLTAPAAAQPASSEIAPDVIQRFVDQQRDALARLQALDEGKAARAILTSPFVSVVTYSVLDAWRLVLAHNRRHFEQARRVAQVPGFPPPEQPQRAA